MDNEADDRCLRRHGKNDYKPVFPAKKLGNRLGSITNQSLGAT